MLPPDGMQHTFYAVFDTPEAAAEAVAELERHAPRSPSRSRITPIVHRQEVTTGAELHAGESGFRHGAFIGGAAGLVLGVLAGALVANTGTGGAPLMEVMGGLLGLAYGTLMGGISAANGPDATLEKLSLRMHDREVLLTVEAGDLTLENDGEDVIKRHGGRIRHRHIV